MRLLGLEPTRRPIRNGKDCKTNNNFNVYSSLCACTRTSFIIKTTLVLHHNCKGISGQFCTLTFNQVSKLVTDPVTSRWLRPSSKSFPPTRAHWGQHCKWPSLSAPWLAGLVWTTIIITLVVTWVQHQEGSHQHRLQCLQRKMTDLLQ